MPAAELKGVIRGYRRDQVVTTALAVFGRTGTLDASMEEIAAEAGVSRSTIYNHFRDRDELLAACASFSHGRLAAAMRDAVDRPVEPEALLAGFFAAALGCLDENPGFYRLSTGLRADGAEAVLGHELAAAATESRAQIDRLVGRLVEAGSVADADVAVSMVGLVLIGALERRAGQADPPPAADEAAVLARVLLHGVAR